MVWFRSHDFGLLYITAWTHTNYKTNTLIAVILIICPIAIAYSYGTDNKIGLHLSVCLSVRVSSLSRSHFFVDFHQIWQRCKPPKVRTSSLGSISPHPFPYFTPKIAIFGPEFLKINANTKNEISALNVHVSPKFPRVIGNRGRGTRRWRQIFDRK